MAEFGSSKERLPSFSESFQTAFSNIKAFNASIGFKKEDNSENNHTMEGIPNDIVHTPSSTISALDTHLANKQFLTSNVKGSEKDTNKNYRANAGEIHTKFIPRADTANFCPKRTIKTGEFAMGFNEASSSKIYLQNSQADDLNVFSMHTHETNAPAGHTNSNQQGKIPPKIIAEALQLYSKYTAQASSSKIHLQNSRTDDFNIFSIHTRDTNASAGHTNSSQQVQIPQKGIVDALELRSKYTTQASSSKIHLQNSQTDACNISSANIRKTNASERGTNTTQQVKITTKKIIADSLQMCSKYTAQASSSKIHLKNSQTDACNILSINTHYVTQLNKNKIFRDELMTRSKNANQASPSSMSPSKVPLHNSREIVQVYLCQECDSKFQWNLYLMIQNPPGATGYKCKLCPTFYEARRHLSKHLRFTHLVTDNYACELCVENSKSRTMRDYAPEFFNATYRILR